MLQSWPFFGLLKTASILGPNINSESKQVLARSSPYAARRRVTNSRKDSLYSVAAGNILPRVYASSVPVKVSFLA